MLRLEQSRPHKQQGTGRGTNREKIILQTLAERLEILRVKEEYLHNY
jgi:hypothetical protein